MAAHDRRLQTHPAGALDGRRFHSTPSGGRHWLFRHVPGVTNSAGRIVPGVDTRGEGSYIIMPPSAGYSVIHEADIARWPLGLLWQVLEIGALPLRSASRLHGAHADLSRITAKRLAGKLRALLANVTSAPRGKVHDTLLRIARTVGGYLPITMRRHHTDVCDEDITASRRCAKCMTC